MSEEFPPKGAAMPRHVAIIMDGNGRWAKQRGMPRAYGHRQGVLALEPIIEACGEWGIEALTIFAFSTENWARPKEEIAALMGLIVEFFNKKIDEYDFSGKTIIPFNVHNGSRFSRTIQTIQELEPDATVVEDGFTVSEQTVAEAAEDVAAWLESLGY